VLYNSDVQWLIQFEQHGSIELDFFLTLELKHKGFIENRVGRTTNLLGNAAVLQEAYRDLNMLVLAHIYEVHKSRAFDHVTAKITLARVESFFDSLALARHVHWHSTGRLLLAVGLGCRNGMSLALVWE
jgi:hypothetical protein